MWRLPPDLTHVLLSFLVSDTAALLALEKTCVEFAQAVQDWRYEQAAGNMREWGYGKGNVPHMDRILSPMLLRLWAHYVPPFVQSPPQSSPQPSDHLLDLQIQILKWESDLARTMALGGIEATPTRLARVLWLQSSIWEGKTTLHRARAGETCPKILQAYRDSTRRLCAWQRLARAIQRCASAHRERLPFLSQFFIAQLDPLQEADARFNLFKNARCLISKLGELHHIRIQTLSCMPPWCCSTLQRSPWSFHMSQRLCDGCRPKLEAPQQAQRQAPFTYVWSEPWPIQVDENLCCFSLFTFDVVELQQKAAYWWRMPKSNACTVAWLRPEAQCPPRMSGCHTCIQAVTGGTATGVGGMCFQTRRGKRGREEEGKGILQSVCVVA